MHDGDSLWDASTTWNGQEWGVDEIVSAAAGGRRRSATSSSSASPTPGRGRGIEYLPQKPFEAMVPKHQRCPLRHRGPEFGQVLSTAQVRSDAYLRFLVEELKPYIDENFPTLPDRDNTFVMGSSMGGLISIYAISEYPDVFGGAACLSTHWPGSMYPDDSPFPALTREYLKANIPPARGALPLVRLRQRGTGRLLPANYQATGRPHRARQGLRQRPLDHVSRRRREPQRERLARPPAPSADVSAGAAAGPAGGAGHRRLAGRHERILAGHRSPGRAALLDPPGRRGRGEGLAPRVCGSPTRRNFGQGFRLDSAAAQQRATRPGSSPGASGAWCATTTTSCWLRFADAAGRRFDLRVRAFDDGIGFRYEVPGNSPVSEASHIVDELTEFQSAGRIRPPGGFRAAATTATSTCTTPPASRKSRPRTPR